VASFNKVIYAVPSIKKQERFRRCKVLKAMAYTALLFLYGLERAPSYRRNRNELRERRGDWCLIVDGDRHSCYIDKRPKNKAIKTFKVLVDGCW